jgi:hypothetical protein
LFDLFKLFHSLPAVPFCTEASRLTFFKEEPKEGTKWQPLLKKRVPGGERQERSDKEKVARKRSRGCSFGVSEER